MSEFQIISDGSLDLPPETAAAKGIKVVPFYVSFDHINYKKEIEEIGIREFYQEMVDHPKVYPASSLPSVEDYLEAFRPFAQEGIPVLCICITTKFSGSYNSASTAAQILAEEYPACRIEVIDAMVNTVLQGLLVLEAVRMKENGLSFEQTVSEVNRIKETGRIIFTIGSMDYLQKGGRIGKLLSMAAGTLGIRPLIVLKEGEIFPFGVSRSRKKSMVKLLEYTKKHFESTGEKPEDYQFCVGYGYDREEAEQFRKDLIRSVSSYAPEPEIGLYQIGATIGVHTGPYPVGLGLLKRYDR